MPYYVTVGAVGTAATNTAAALTTGPDGGTVAAVRIPSGVSRISMIGSAITISAAQILDTGNVMFVELSGAGLVDGTQQLVIGATKTDETGTSVTGEFTEIPALYQRTNIRVVPGNDITLSGFYNGTDSGSQVFVITLELS